jgi:predicted amidophosphoribosyltransferase
VPQRLSKIDALLLEDYSYLNASDEYYFMREFTRGVGWKGGATNNLIDNLKKDMKYKGTKVLKYKTAAIKQAAAEFAGVLNKAWLQIATLVPVPPSKTTDHPDYDDRMTKILRLIGKYAGLTCDVRELVFQTEDMEPAHKRKSRPRPEDYEAVYEINEKLADPCPKVIGVFDDMLTTGSHFRAMKHVLSNRFPGVEIIGFSVARRVIPESERA